MKRSSLFFLLLFFAIPLPSAQAASYVVKNLELNGGGSSFVRDLTVSSSGSDLYVRTFVTPLPGSDRRHKVTLSGLPSNVSSVSYSISSSDCSSISNVSLTSGGFSYEFPGNCDGVLVARYLTAGISDGTHTFSAVVTDCWAGGICGDGDDSSSSTNTATVTVDPKATLLRAVTIDADADGFLDAYDLYWNRTPTAILSTGQARIRVDSRFASSVSYSAGTASRGTLSFADGFFSSGEIPRVEIDGDVHYQTGSYYIWVAEDGAAPSATPSVTPGTYTGAITVSFSLSESGTVRYAFWTGAANASSNLYSSGISISSATVLSTYSADVAGNSRTQNFAYSFVCAVSAPANWSVSPYPACVVSCNSGYSLSWGACVASGGWYSGGSSSWGSSGWSSWGSSGGGSIGIPSQPSISHNPATISSSTADLPYFTNLSGALSYLELKVFNAETKRDYAKAALDIGIDDSAYYFSFDSALKKEYNRTVNAFVLFFILSDKARNFTLTETEKSEYAWADSVLASAKLWAKKIEERYVSTYRYPTGATVYRTNYEPIKLVMSKLEKRYVGKFNLLLSSKTVDEKTYFSAIDGWNRFVLHLSVFRAYGRLEASKTRALAGIAAFEPIYKKRVRITVTPTVQTPSENPTTQAVAAPFPKDLFYGQTSDDVRRLQQMLKNAGYFWTLSPTGYFWPSTKSFLARFSEEVLKVPNPEGIFSGKVREAANAYLVR